MKKLLVLLLSAVMALTICVPAFAAETASQSQSYYPIVGSWILDKVYENKDGQSVLLKKEEAQSVYGSGKSVYTFDEDGAAHDIMFDAGDSVDNSATWKTTSPDVYVYTDENGMEMTFTYNASEGTLHRSFTTDAADATYKNLDFVYARAITGSWRLHSVLEVNPGDAPVVLSKEENQSLYADSESTITFNADGTASQEIKDGPDTVVHEATWEMTNPDKFVCKTAESAGIHLDYFRVDDTLFRNVIDESPEAAHHYLRFIYERYEEPAPEAQAADNSAAPAQNASQQGSPKSQNNAPKKTGRSMDLQASEGGGLFVTLYELTDGTWVDADGKKYEKLSDKEWLGPNDSKWVTDEYFQDNPVGKIYTGFEMYVCDPANPAISILIKQLTDGRYVDEETGIIYTQEGGGGEHFYGDDGSTWIIEGAINNVTPAPAPDNSGAVEEDEVINGGQIFTGFTMTVYNEQTGEPVVLSELSQGGYTDQATGEIFQQEGGGGEHLYGDRGTVLVFQLNNDYAEAAAPVEEDEVIADGQIFNGMSMTLFNPDTGNAVIVHELNQGGWADDYGVVYEQEGGGGDHFYGNDGSVLVTEWYYMENIAE